MVQLRDEHRRHPVDGGAALRLDRPQRGVGIERLTGDDHGAAMRDGRQVAKHAAEAVIEGNRQANPVVFRVAQHFANEVTVVQNVVVESVAPFGDPVVPEVY